MNLGTIALKIRLAGTSFGDRVGGIADLAAIEDRKGAFPTLPAAFVVPLPETATPNDVSGAVVQKVEEEFGVVALVDNATTTTDRSGLAAMNQIHALRAEIFGAILGWQYSMDRLIEYAGGSVQGFDRAHLLYMFRFKTGFMLSQKDGVTEPESPDELEKIVIGYDVDEDGDGDFTDEIDLS